MGGVSGLGNGQGVGWGRVRVRQWSVLLPVSSTGQIMIII